MKIFSQLICLTLLISISFASNSNEFANPNQPIIVSSAQPTISLKLKSNLTTGYSWLLVKYNNQLIKPLNSKYVTDDSKKIGAGGYEIWTFQFTKEAFLVPQLIQIKMVYAQPWNLKNTKYVKFKFVTHK